MGNTSGFNPHGNVTADGVLITLGMPVTDYDRRIGWIAADLTSPSMCENGYCKGDHWFEVEHGDQSTGMFNGTRVESRIVHLHPPTSAQPECGAPIPADRMNGLTAYRSEITCAGCKATLR